MKHLSHIIFGKTFLKSQKNSNLLYRSINFINLEHWLEGHLKIYFNLFAKFVAFQDQESLSKLHYNTNIGKSKFNNSLTFNTLNLNDNSDDEDKLIQANQLLGNKGEDDNSTTKEKTDTEDALEFQIEGEGGINREAGKFRPK